MKALYLACLAMLIPLTASAEVGAGSTINFEGTAQIVAVTNACVPDGFAVGQFDKIVYRMKVASSDPGDALTITAGGTFRIISTDPSGSLNGSVQSNQEDISGYGNFGTATAQTSNLTIASLTGTSVAASTFLKIAGTIDDAFITPGCTLTIRSALVKRVIQ